MLKAIQFDPKFVAKYSKNFIHILSDRFLEISQLFLENVIALNASQIIESFQVLLAAFIDVFISFRSF